MSLYLCYDLKGIQQYIFQIPKLTCCIGGSRMIDAFDREEACGLNVPGTSVIFTGGGRGAFLCENRDAMERLKQKLVCLAREKALTIRFGMDEDYSRASREIRETFCYQPDSLEGHPCELSGLYPTEAPDGIHPLIAAREKAGRADPDGSGSVPRQELEFLNEVNRKHPGGSFRFFHNVNADDRDGFAGAVSLGCRNRWAVVCMDGNDMGLQFLKFRELKKSEVEWQEWLKKMSRKLDECTRKAAAEGIARIADAYLAEDPRYPEILPIRPLIVGGDDVTILVACRYAIPFVEAVMEAFERESAKTPELWVGTGGKLTISAGILFSPVSLPLHSALNYTEMLLASAKTHGRDLRQHTGSPGSPACLDWETVTEGLLDSPAARRQREFLFEDPETGNRVELTSRPYSKTELDSLEEMKQYLQDIPRNIQYQFHPALLAEKPRRMAFYARIGKNYSFVKDALIEPVEDINDRYGTWWEISGNRQRTRVLDALLLLQEEYRSEQETIFNEED